MLTATLVLLAGCRHKSGMEILSAQMDGLKGLRSQYVVHRPGEKDVLVDILFSKPNRILATSENFVIALNEIDGHFESNFSEKIYDTMPWDGHVYPGTGKIVASEFVNAGPASANPPNKIVPEVPWKLESTKNGVERYTKTIRGADGPLTFKLEISDQGRPVQFISPGDVSYIVKRFEVIGEQPIEKFRVEPREGFLSHRVVPDLLMLQTGEPFGWAKFKTASDVSSFKLEGNTMFVLVDPAEMSSQNAVGWAKQPATGYRKVMVSKGNATSGFYDPTGKEIDQMTSSTPTFVMVGKDSKIMAMWSGFDPDDVTQFEMDIAKALNKGH